MTMQQLMADQKAFTQRLCEQMKKDHTTVKQLAEDMAECATNIRGQGYSAFMDARNRFLTQIEKMHDSYSELFAGSYKS